jgi:hypothetical protein
VIFRRSRFTPVVESQLDLFEREHHDLLALLEKLLDEYNRAERDEAEEAFGEYMDAHALAAELLEEMRDSYARTLDDPDEYVDVFKRVVRRRMPVTATELD